MERPRLKDQCECPEEGVATDPREYDEAEYPAMKHAPGECRCVAGLAQYRRGRQILTLCSGCNLGGDIPLAVAERLEKEGIAL